MMKKEYGTPPPKKKHLVYNFPLHFDSSSTFKMTGGTDLPAQE